MTEPALSIDWQSKLAARTRGFYGSMTRKLMSVLADPEVISFGGGLPAWDLFPLEQIREVTDELLRLDGPMTLQYNQSEGFPPFREAIAGRCRPRGIDATPDDVLVVTGTMQGIDLLGKLFLEPGDVVALGDPTFLTALQAFTTYQARFVTVPLDEDGMDVDRLPALLEAHDVKLIYVMPTFQNPTGITLSLARRKRLLDVAGRYGVPIVEDDAYGELRFEGEDLPTLKALDTGDYVFHLSSFSKTLSPGLRVGYVIAPRAVQEKLLLAKQSADLHTSVLSQRIVHEFLRRGCLDPHIEALRGVYEKRRDAMLDAMEERFPSGVRWSRPEGGIFCWVTLPEGADADRILEAAIDEGVMYVPGSCYHAEGGGRRSLRLNYSASTEESIRVGIERLARVIRRS